MSNASSIFNTTFFVILGIIIIVIGLMVIYFENKMREQNHKISSMLSLVSSLAEELNAVKFHLNHMNMVGSGMKQMNTSFNIPINSSETNNLGEDLIEVSDDEGERSNDGDDSDDEEDDDDDDNDSDNDSDNDDSDNDDSDDDVDDMDVLELHPVDDNNKLLLLNKLNEDDIKILNINEITHNNIKNDDDSDDDDDDDDDDEFNMIETFDIEDIDSDDDDDDDKKVNAVPIVEIDDIVLKSNNEKDIFVNLEKSKNIEVIDYKKLSLNKLKSVVLDKGLATDTSKMKKNDLLKLLGIE
jgi:hypothetical protein